MHSLLSFKVMLQLHGKLLKFLEPTPFIILEPNAPCQISLTLEKNMIRHGRSEPHKSIFGLEMFKNILEGMSTLPNLTKPNTKIDPL